MIFQEYFDFTIQLRLTTASILNIRFDFFPLVDCEELFSCSFSSGNILDLGWIIDWCSCCLLITSFDLDSSFQVVLGFHVDGFLGFFI